MTKINTSTQGPVSGGPAASQRSLGIVESTALGYLDGVLKQHWNLGQNILLCWTLDAKGMLLLVAPHYFLGNFTASLTDCAPVDRLDALNGSFIRSLISGSRHLSASEFQGAASRLELTPLRVPVPITFSVRPVLVQAMDEMVRKYSITYVKNRAVLLFDIVNFSLVTPFEQTSQLNSLSYSLNSAHNKLREHNIEINFSRTTTGDGYYIWNQNDGPLADLELFQFMLLVLADNAIALRAAKMGKGVGQIAPLLRSGFHIGSLFEFCQVEGLNPGINRYIVGDVTIELARMLDIAEAGQVFVGKFSTQMPTSDRDSAYLVPVDSERFVERASRHVDQLLGVKLSGQQIRELHCFLTGINGASGGRNVRRVKITDKHGRSRDAYNLRVNIRLSDHHQPIIVGLPGSTNQRRTERRGSRIMTSGLSNSAPLRPAKSSGLLAKARSTASKPAVPTTEE